MRATHVKAYPLTPKERRVVVSLHFNQGAQLAVVTPTSQFELFHIFQDRVIKEMRLAHFSMLDAANQFLQGYLPIDNRRFAVQPAQAADLHRPRPTPRELDRILCLKTTRCLRKDFTIAHQRGLYQIHETIRGLPRAGGRARGWTMRITHQGRPLGFHAITSRPVKVAAGKLVPHVQQPVTPKRGHPWRTRLLPERRTDAAVAIT